MTSAGGAAPTPGVALLSITGGTMRVSGSPGQVYVVEVSSDLQNWADLGTVTVGAEGSVDIVDNAAKDFPQRFYRLRSQVPAGETKG